MGRETLYKRSITRELRFGFVMSQSDGLALFLETTRANGVKVVKKVIISKFRFHSIAIDALWGFRNFAIIAHLYQNYL